MAHTLGETVIEPVIEPVIEESNPPVEEHLNPAAPKFSLPARAYLLYGGPIDSAPAMGYWPTPSWFYPQSPSLMWPDDHAWCLATEVDNDSTLVGGSEALITAVTSSPDLEALPIASNEPLLDTVNTYQNGADFRDDTWGQRS